MLSYNQTIEKIKGITEEIKALETKTDIYKHREILREYHKNGNTEAIKKAEADFLKDAEKKQTLKHYLKVYNFNVEKLFILENMQIIIDIFNGFKGKKCGEKTREKIRAEVKEKCGCGLGFDDRSIRIFLYDFSIYKNLYIYTKYIDGKSLYILDNDNKIIELSKDMFLLPDAEIIINDIEGYAEQKQAEFLKLKQMYNALEEATKQYNHNCPFKHQYIREGIYYID